jgi:hypothetical protein
MKWREAGFAWVSALIREGRKRNLEVFWHERFSEVDLNSEGGLEMRARDRIKAAHPDWVIRSWWWQGLWNAAAPGFRDYKLKILRELAANYDFDGLQIDFARHIPCLPPGRQWENREHMTQFMRMVRSMLLEIEKQRGKPFLLAAKVPENLRGCHIDGFDVETWAKENLVDIFTLGSRSLDVDIAAFCRITAGKSVKLQPCLDDHHATDGYLHSSIEFLRGAFSNWWQQGADSVVTFNWAVAPPEVASQIGGTVGPPSQGQAYQEVGSPATMQYKDKRFAVQRRGVFPWAEGYFNRNEDAQLPAVLHNDGRVSAFQIRIGDDFAGNAKHIGQVTLRLILFNASPGDQLIVSLNGAVLAPAGHDPNWKDPQIFSPEQQPSAGSNRFLRQADPSQKLLLWIYKPSIQKFRVGMNQLRLQVLEREPYLPGVDIQVEKIEVDVHYLEG